MAQVFECLDYKQFLRDWLRNRPKGGRGESRRIALTLKVSTTLVSQVINGEKHFTMEAASDLCDFLGLSDRETDHFLLLVDFARAGSVGLRSRLRRRIDASREGARKVSERLERDKDLSEAHAAIYFSHWIYTGMTHYVATQPHATVEKMAERFQVPPAMIARVLGFLVDSGVLVNRGTDGFEIVAQRTFLSKESPLVVKQAQNWRIKGFNHMPFSGRDNFFFTMPMSLSQEVADKIRDDLAAYIEKIGQWVGPSKSEVVRCLNIDWFDY